MGTKKKATASSTRREAVVKGARRSKPGAPSARPEKQRTAPPRPPAKQRRAAAKGRPAPSQSKAPANKAVAPPPPRSRATPKPRASEPRPALEPRGAARSREKLGVVTAPSGRVVVFDVGLLGALDRDEMTALQVALDGLPTDRVFDVTGRRLGTGRFPECWADVTLELAPGRVVASSRELGRAPVDFARLMIIDGSALDAWNHEEPMDGRADFVWWGRDAAALARATGAPAQAEGFGWIDVPVAECIALGQHAEGLKAKHGWLLRTDYRPHSHHYVVLAQIRATPTESGTVHVGGATATAFRTTWGDGVFPVHVDLDATGAPVALRIELATAEAIANLDAVN